MGVSPAAHRGLSVAFRAGMRVIFMLAVLALASPVLAQGPGDDPRSDTARQVSFHFFWSVHCPHCHDAIPFIERLVETRPWVRLVAHELSTSRDGGALYRTLAARFDEEARAVPGFVFCDTFLVGYDDEAGIGAEIERRLDACFERMQVEGLSQREPGPWPEADRPDATFEGGSIHLPLVGQLAFDAWSLPALTIFIAALDAFNPCAFFVLLFLLSILANTRSRARMFLVGGIFVAISGIIYFAFMAAWLNVFLLFGEIALITRIAGAIALIMALINIKDYFWFRRGVSLSIPESAKPGLFGRMRGLTAESSFPVLLGGTIALAVTVNLYEVLCTIGLPMVYTRILTLHALGPLEYYAYLLLYNLIYVLPLAIIVTAFALTLGKRKLQEHEGRLLKLVSGMMMLGLGAVLLFAPDLLANPLLAIGLLLAAVMVALLVFMVDRRGAART